MEALHIPQSYRGLKYYFVLLPVTGKRIKNLGQGESVDKYGCKKVYPGVSNVKHNPAIIIFPRC